MFRAGRKFRHDNPRQVAGHAADDFLGKGAHCRRWQNSADSLNLVKSLFQRVPVERERA